MASAGRRYDGNGWRRRENRLVSVGFVEIFCIHGRRGMSTMYNGCNGGNILASTLTSLKLGQVRRGSGSLLLHLTLISKALHLVLLHCHPLQILYTPFEKMRVRSKPGVRHDHVQSRTSNRIWDEHQGQQLASFRGNVVRKGQGRVHDVSVQQIDVVTIRICGVIVEGKISCEHGVEDNSARPDIDRGTNVCTFRDDQLWCGVTRTTATCLHKIVCPVFEAIREPEVGDNDIAVSIQQKIFQL